MPWRKSWYIADMIQYISGRLKIYELAPDNKDLARFAFIIEDSVNAVSRAG